VVLREEIREKLWPTGTFVDFDNGLNSAVNRLRDALGDSASEPKFIETVPRRGYRLLVPVNRERARNEEVSAGSSAKRLELENSRLVKRRVWGLRLAAAVGVFAVMALASTGVLRRAASTPAAHGAIAERLTPVPLVTYAGGEQWLPAFSPDGSRVAYSWSTAGGWFLEVKLLGSDTYTLAVNEAGSEISAGPDVVARRHPNRVCACRRFGRPWDFHHFGHGGTGTKAEVSGNMACSATFSELVAGRAVDRIRG
jgi:hypothetical protein